VHVWSLHDLVEVEHSGVPTLLVVTEPFAVLAPQTAAPSDLPSARIVVVGHPIGGVGPDVIEARDRAAEEVPLSLLGAQRS